jgi:hypothetical protein
MVGAKLVELRGLDMSALPQSWASSPVLPPATSAPATTADEREYDDANYPVYVPPHLLPLSRILCRLAALRPPSALKRMTALTILCTFLPIPVRSLWCEL